MGEMIVVYFIVSLVAALAAGLVIMLFDGPP